MSALINIAGLTPVEDPSYRYKMPKVSGKVEGRGNGIKTVLANVNDLSLALNREAPEITKFFGCELGSQTTFAADTERAIVNGAHTDRDLQNHLYRYIENFVLCKSCRLPETYYKIKAGIISQRCNACGAKHAVDMTHKLTTFILAQHKKAKETATRVDKEKDKSEKKDKKIKKGTEGEDREKDGEKKEKKNKKDKSSKSAGAGDGEDADGDLNGEEGSPGLVDEAESVAIAESIDRFKLWLADNGSASPSVVMDELRVIQAFGSFRPADRVIIYVGATMTEHLISGSEVAAHKHILSLWNSSAPLQRHLIAGFEWFCGVRYPQLSKLFPIVLKTLFDEELVEEDVIFSWHTDSIRNEFTADPSLISLEVLEQLRAASSPFITWLQEAEVEGEEGDEEEEDDEDVNIDDI